MLENNKSFDLDETEKMCLGLLAETGTIEMRSVSSQMAVHSWHVAQRWKRLFISYMMSRM